MIIRFLSLVGTRSALELGTVYDALYVNISVGKLCSLSSSLLIVENEL